MEIFNARDKALNDNRIEDVVGKYVVLKKQGKDLFGLCPFHNEKTPSFSVDVRKQRFKCFGCGEGGDAIDFIMKQEARTFVDAIKFLGIDVDKPSQPPKYVERSIMERSMSGYDRNVFIRWLVSIAGAQRVDDVLQKYVVGTGNDGSTIYWQIDLWGNVRTAQKIMYHPNGHRIKEKPVQRLFKNEEGYRSCLFGEHLIGTYKRGEDIVVVVESEKTALIASIWLPEMFGYRCIYIATCGVNGLRCDRLLALKHCKLAVICDFSDSSRKTWRDIIPEIKKTISRDVIFLDDRPDLNDGSDIADVLIECELESDVLNEPDDLELPT